MERLLAIGFFKVGSWLLEAGLLRLDLQSHHKAERLLYAFISNGDVKYVGYTRKSLEQRMGQYFKPVSGQRTNIRVNASIVELLREGAPLDIYIMLNNGLLTYGGFPVDLAAGLESALIADEEVDPEWNIHGKEKAGSPRRRTNPGLVTDRSERGGERDGERSFNVKLKKTYYNQGYFNVPVRKSGLLVQVHGAEVKVQLGDGPETVIMGYLSRKAVKSGTPRIFFRASHKTSFINWIQQNFSLEESMQVIVVSDRYLKLLPSDT